MPQIQLHYFNIKSIYLITSFQHYLEGIFGLYNNEYWENSVFTSIEILDLKKSLRLSSDFLLQMMIIIYGYQNEIENQQRVDNSIG
ncbi:unnamed protein product (macronuclear) [Paramecium tetraurelia]|uniref:Uncharacterized protein n=1 Tax=Paramecium tetraurelia TaxID=5888 RepID=A0BMW4_PARTE|nr:uncharacterized protein GSPATT00030518001 [Paramecium tetraurelia]CAK59881.1 unnamed protein product [Paramecium tetraurelia]|eukprot:XP_001427279.1 hypothetical protein (macronuclear) [Paramecium tetraurelia strain d4-2]